MQADSTASESPQSVAVGQSHTVEIVSPAPGQSSSVAASPSMIIAVAGASPQQMKPDSAAIRASNPAPPPARPAIPAANEQPLIVTEPAAIPPEKTYLGRRERNRRKQLTISVILLLLVIVLAFVLIWVLNRNANQTPSGKTAAIGQFSGDTFQVLVAPILTPDT